MSRGLTVGVINAITSEVTRRCIAVALEFDSGTVRLTSTPYAMTIGGAEYLSAGGLGSISQMEEGSDLSVYGMTLELTGIPRDMVAVALAEPYQNRRATIWNVALDENFQPIADPIVIFRGLMDLMEVTLGSVATVRVSLLNRLRDWSRARVVRYSDEDQQRLHDGDFGFQYVTAMVDRSINWPTAGWFRENLK